MKVQIVGLRRMQFNSKDGGEVNGVKLYIVGRNPDVTGLIADNIWIDVKNPVFATACNINLSNGPVDADLVYEQYPGVRKPLLTAINVA